MRALAVVLAACLSLSVVGGCGDVGIDIDDLVVRLTDAVGVVQTRPQTLPPVLQQRGDVIVINADVRIITDPAQDVFFAELPNRTVLAFENDTGRDIYIRYFADGILQGVFVFASEALLLEYPCLSVIELISEDDVDPFTGLLVDSFDLTGINYFNPEDFFCGDAFILNFDPFSVGARAEVVDLWP